MLDWENELWIKLYYKETADFAALPMHARHLFEAGILKIVNRKGIFDLGKSGLKSLAPALRGNWAEIEPCVQALLEEGCIELRDGGKTLVVKNYVAAQSARMSEAARKRRYRADKRAVEPPPLDSSEAAATPPAVAPEVPRQGCACPESGTSGPASGTSCPENGTSKAISGRSAHGRINGSNVPNPGHHVPNLGLPVPNRGQNVPEEKRRDTLTDQPTVDLAEGSAAVQLALGGVATAPTREPAAKPKTKKAENVDIARIRLHYEVEYERVRGLSPPTWRSQETGFAWDLLRSFGGNVDRILNVITRAFDDPFFADKVTIGFLCRDPGRWDTSKKGSNVIPFRTAAARVQRDETWTSRVNPEVEDAYTSGPGEKAF